MQCFCLQCGGDLHAQNVDGLTPLFCAVQQVLPPPIRTALRRTLLVDSIAAPSLLLQRVRILRLSVDAIAGFVHGGVERRVIPLIGAFLKTTRRTQLPEEVPTGLTPNSAALTPHGPSDMHSSERAARDAHEDGTAAALTVVASRWMAAPI